jgi:hypothetical protein
MSAAIVSLSAERAKRNPQPAPAAERPADKNDEFIPASTVLTIAEVFKVSPLIAILAVKRATLASAAERAQFDVFIRDTVAMALKTPLFIEFRNEGADVLVCLDSLTATPPRDPPNGTYYLPAALTGTNG